MYFKVPSSAIHSAYLLSIRHTQSLLCVQACSVCEISPYLCGVSWSCLFKNWAPGLGIKPDTFLWQHMVVAWRENQRLSSHLKHCFPAAQSSERLHFLFFFFWYHRLYYLAADKPRFCGFGSMNSSSQACLTRITLSYRQWLYLFLWKMLQDLWTKGIVRTLTPFPQIKTCPIKTFNSALKIKFQRFVPLTRLLHFRL